MTEPMASPHVLIVGGGLAGPALAIALARRSIRSTIFEIRPARQDLGGSIALGPNACRIFDRTLGLYQQVRAIGYPYRKMTMYDDSGVRYGDVVFDKEDSEYDSVRIMRSEVHRVLLEKCAQEKIPIIWGARDVHIEQDDLEVRVAFADDKTTYKGTVLVGADGIHSKVREFVLDNPPEPKYIGSCTVASFVDRAKLNLPTDFQIPAGIVTPLGLIMTVPVTHDGSRLTFGVSEPLEEPKTRAGWQEYERSGDAARRAKANYKDVQSGPVKSLIDNVNPTAARLWAPYSIPTLSSWHKGRTVLIGDAAHALPPNGQGSAMAFEDATILARLIAEASTTAQTTPSWAKVFDKFESVRRPRIDEVQKISKGAGQVKKSRTNPVLWYLMRWGVWFVFWWKGGKMSAPGIGRDVEADLDK